MTVLKPGDQRRFILDEEEIMREMIYVVETHQNPPAHWPSMRAYEGTLEDLRLNYPNNKHFLCIFENDDSYIARKVSSQKKISAKLFGYSYGNPISKC
jgi:hypothetical protein